MADEGVRGGELLFCGATSWESIGRVTTSIVYKTLKETNLVSPTRLQPLIGVDIRLVVSGCSSHHCVALDVEGRCYTWGRNGKGQLGHGDTVQRDRPTIVSELSKYKIIGAATGRYHTVVVTEDGNSFAFGWNKHGQLGSGSTKNEIEPCPVRCIATDVKNVASGADFTVWLSSVEGASILTAGLPQYGQLGHGTDHEYNTKTSAVKLAYEAQPCPKAIASLAEQTIVKVACGTNHTVAVDSNGYVYTWGFGGYGRLGHREQKDEWVPRRVYEFTRHVLPPDAVVSAGSVSSSCTAAGGQLYMWGKIKNGGDEWMYPKPLLDLSGWNIRCMHSGSMHHFVGADDSCISWGHAQFGELGYGPNEPKTSIVPKKVDILEGMHVISVACGFAHSMVVVGRANVMDRLEQLEVYDGKEAEEASEEPISKSPAVKRPTKKAAGRTPDQKTKKRKSEDSSENESSGSEDDHINGDPENKRKRGGKAGRGRGKAAGRTPDKKTKKRKSEDSSENKCNGSEDDHINGEPENKGKRGGKAGRGRGKTAYKSSEQGRGRGCPKKTTEGNGNSPSTKVNVKTPGKRGRSKKA